jgi:hypothetical protein
MKYCLNIDIGLLSCNAAWTEVSAEHAASIFKADNGGSMFLRNVGIFSTNPHGVSTEKVNSDLSTATRTPNK